MVDIFHVLSDSTRRDILLVLLEEHKKNREISVSEIVNRLGITQPTVSKQLKVLKSAELVTIREDGVHRFYKLDYKPLEQIEDFILQFLNSDIDDRITIELVEREENDIIIGEKLETAAESIGKVAAEANKTVRELVARFRLK